TCALPICHEVKLRFGTKKIGGRKRFALGRKNSCPAECERNGCRHEQDRHEKCRETRIQMAERRKQIKHRLRIREDYFAAKSLRTTVPPFRTNFTSSRTGAFSRGLPSTAMMSAKFPASIAPAFTPMRSAALMVAAWIASIGFMPHSTILPNCLALSP